MSKELLKKLFDACEDGDLTLVKKIVEDHNVDPSACRGVSETTPLHRAAEGAQLDVMKYLIKDKGCDPTVKGGLFSSTPLHLACGSGDLEVVKYLTEELHLDPNSKTFRNRDRNTPLHHAAMSGQLEVVMFLVEVKHCDPMARNKYGRTALEIADRHQSVVDYLQRHGKGEADAMDKTSLTLAGASTGIQSDSITRLREDDVGYLVEILASYSGKWREIGVQLGFTPNELDSLPFSPKPANCLTYMLNEWTQWAIGGSHNKYATLEDLERALQSRIVNLGVVANELRGKWMRAKGVKADIPTQAGSVGFSPQPQLQGQRRNTKPEFHELDLLKSKGKTVRIMERTAAKWERVATRLYFGGHDISSIKKDPTCLSPEDACRKVFTEWLDGKGRKPVTWGTLIEVLDEAEISEVAKDIETVLSL